MLPSGSADCKEETAFWPTAFFGPSTCQTTPESSFVQKQICLFVYLIILFYCILFYSHKYATGFVLCGPSHATLRDFQVRSGVDQVQQLQQEKDSVRQQVDAAHSREAAARNVQERLGGASGKCG